MHFNLFTNTLWFDSYDEFQIGLLANGIQFQDMMPIFPFLTFSAAQSSHFSSARA